jgi:hypothetical protein
VEKEDHGGGGMVIRALFVFLAASMAASPVVMHRRPRGSGGTWFHSGYAYRISVTIDAAQIASTLTNYPLYIDLDDMPDSFHAAVQTDGDDIRASDELHLAARSVELVRIDTTAKTGELHILVPSVSSSANTLMHVYYGHASATAFATPEDVWAGYMGVWHMDASGELAQPSSTGNALLDADPVSLASGASIAGKLGNCITYDGGSDWSVVPQVDAANLLQPDNTVSMSCWFAADDFADQGILSNQADSTNKGLGLWSWSSNFRASLAGSGNPWTNLTESTAGKTASTWYHLGFTYDGTTSRLYFNGAEADSYAVTSSHIWATQPFYFARRESGSAFDGELDEIRLSNATLSADWIATEYHPLHYRSRRTAMKIAILSALFAAFTLTAAAETLADLSARMVSTGLVVSTGTPKDAGVAQAVNDATGERLLSEMRLPITVTVDAAGSQRSTSTLILVYDLGQATESAHITDPDARNYVATAPGAKELLYLGRQTLIYLRDNAVPLPSTPTDALPLVISQPEWHGRVISYYNVRKDQTTVAGVAGSVVTLKLVVDGGLDDKFSVFIWTRNGQFIVDPYEN